MPLTLNTYQGIGVARALQFGRIMKIMRYFRGVNHLFAVLSMSIPAMLNVVILFILMMFVFAILGMQLFASVRNGPFLDELAGFTTFPEAALTLFQIVAGENWIPIMRDCAIEAPACTMPSGTSVQHWHDSGDCGTSAGSGLFFFGFFIMVFCVFLNLFVAIVLDTFIMFQSTNRESSEDNQGIRINENDFTIFKELWFELDPESTGCIASCQVDGLITSLHEKVS